MSRGSKWYAQRHQESTIKRGDRVAIVGRGTALIREIDSKGIQVVLGNKTIVRIARKRVSWSKQNVRWETSPYACYAVNGKGMRAGSRQSFLFRCTTISQLSKTSRYDYAVGLGREGRNRTAISGMEPRRISVVMLLPRAANSMLSRAIVATSAAQFAQLL
jgi:preprotein translocase subunit YajC